MTRRITWTSSSTGLLAIRIPPVALHL
jgi:hypothetical protein